MPTGFVHGKNTVVKINGVNLSAYANSTNFNRSSDNHDVTTFGKNSHVYVNGLKDGTGTVSGIYDSTASTGPSAALRSLVGGAAVPYIFQPEGTGTGKPQASVSVCVTAFEETAPVADMTTWSCTLQFTDDITDTVQA